MNALPLPLTARNFGEWLAALGLLRLADSLAPGGTLHFDADDRPILTTAADESALVVRLVESGAPAQLRARSFTPAAAPAATTVRIGDAHFSEAEESLEGAGALVGDDAKSGFSLRWPQLGPPVVSHFLGEAAGEGTGLRSPLKMWAGQVTLPSIVRHLAATVATQSPAQPLASLLALHGPHPQRLRFDHRAEQYLEDGGHTIAPGRDTRPAIEWLGLIALSFFPPEAGDTALLAGRRRLRAALWREPLTAPAILLALHYGSPADSFHFAVASDGKFKKLRPAEAGRSLSHS